MALSSDYKTLRQKPEQGAQPASDERGILALLAERDEGEGVPFSSVPFVVPKGDGPRPHLLDRQTRALLARLKAAGLVEERAVLGENVYFALTPRGQQKLGRRSFLRSATAPAGPVPVVEADAPVPGRFWVNSVAVPAVVAAITVIVLKIVGL
jgi:hypothetical protein